MEISFQNKQRFVYREFYRQTKRTQESAECVVPDTEADIEKIAAVQTAVLLKSKDLTGRGVLLTGEAEAAVLYIREGQEGMSVLRVKKSFSLEYEVEGLESDSLAQAALLIQGTDVRIVNPRKISLSFEIEGRLSCYRSESLLTETKLPEENNFGLHARTEERSLTLPNAVCEKSIALNEQFVFPAGSPLPARLASEQPELVISDCQLIGSRVIVKGRAEITVCTFSDAAGEPLLTSFSAPFSQILDIGAESMSFCTVRPEITGAYFDLVDTVGGEKALDMELHAVLQLVSQAEYSVRRITDVYSNLMPTELSSEPCSFALSSVPERRELRSEEKISLMEDGAELLCALSSLARVGAGTDQLGAAVNLDLLFRTSDGKLSSVRRTLTVSEQGDSGGLLLLGARVAELTARKDGEDILCSVTLELLCQKSREEETTLVTGVTLSEDHAYETGSFPTLTLVRAGGESLWELARKHHSSVEAILAMNEDAENTRRMLMIPRCI